jgi:hypothetical protein
VDVSTITLEGVSATDLELTVTVLSPKRKFEEFLP